jgi:hypothetical protein
MPIYKPTLGSVTDTVETETIKYPVHQLQSFWCNEWGEKIVRRCVLDLIEKDGALQ